LFQIMRRVQDRVALISEAAHYFQNFLARLRIDTRGRLVEQNQLGSMNQRDREVKAAFHAARVGGDAIVAAFAQADEAEQLIDSLRKFGALDVVDAAEEAQILDTCQ